VSYQHSCTRHSQCQLWIHVNLFLPPLTCPGAPQLTASQHEHSGEGAGWGLSSPLAHEELDEQPISGRGVGSKGREHKDSPSGVIALMLCTAQQSSITPSEPAESQSYKPIWPTAGTWLWFVFAPQIGHSLLLSPGTNHALCFSSHP